MDSTVYCFALFLYVDVRHTVVPLLLFVIVIVAVSSNLSMYRDDRQQTRT